MSKSAFSIVIPARYASTRLPGKLLREVAGEALIRHTVRAAQAVAADEVIVATDDPRIARAVEVTGVELCMTRGDHQSGTERLVEVACARAWDAERIVVNLQADEPLMPAALVARCVGLLTETPQARMSTLASPITEVADIFDPNCVKLVVASDGRALCFSRAPIPWQRDGFPHSLSGSQSCWFRHIGIYAYRAGFLREWPDLPHSDVEQIERLEQLRALVNGVRIQVGVVDSPPAPGVDTEADLQRVAALLEARRG